MEIYARTNRKLYYSAALLAIILMISGLIIGNNHFDEIGIGDILHIALVTVLSMCLLLYPIYEKYRLKLIIIIVASAYFYTIFFIYPETWSTFVFLCLLPAFSILFFDQKLFYFSLILNSLGITMAMIYITVFDQSNLFPHIKADVIGNIINFFGSQMIIYLIYHLAEVRIKKQQHYYEQLQNSQRLKITGQLAAAVAHEIRNPLTVVKGFLQLQSESGTPLNSKEHVDLMINELNTAEHVISQFLSVAKPETDTKKEIVDVQQILHSVTDLISSYGLLHKNTIELKVESECYILANNIEFKQLMVNIIKNAIEASKLGDPIMIATKKVGHSVEITVTDSGYGMDDEELKSLGTPFYSLKSTGTGLGLMISYHIVEKYNGTIQFQSTKGKGTMVKIQFPYIKKAL